MLEKEDSFLYSVFLFSRDLQLITFTIAPTGYGYYSP